MNKTVLWIIGGVVGLGLVILMAVSIAGEEPADASIGFGEVTLEGAPLPVFGSIANDPVVGSPAPVVSGADWNGNPASISPDGTPKIVIFLAHWCQHCRAEVPVVVDWIEEGNLPDGVEMYGITVSTDRLLPNWPPQEWLEDEGWEQPTIMDDAIGTAAAAYGMAGTPFYLVVDGDNNVLVRMSGEIGVQGLNALAEIASGSLS